jgi:hypothetical protein
MSNNLLPTEIVRLYRVWTSIVYRCKKVKNKQYKNYGARGIDICDEWLDFNKFCEDVGKCPVKGYHLDRTDNDKGYFKENCRWVSATTNHRNKRNNKYYETHLGKICQAELIEKINYTKKQFTRCIEKYGEEKFLEMYKNGCLPKKRIVSNLNDIIGKNIGNYYVKTLDPNKSVGARYFCICKCGKETRVSRNNLFKNKSSGCRSCTRMGDKNPNSTTRQLKKGDK